MVSTFSAVNLAAIDDKNQLGVLTLTASSIRPFGVFLAASVTLVSGQ